MTGWTNEVCCLAGQLISRRCWVNALKLTNAHASTIFPINCRLNLQNPPWSELQEKWGWPELQEKCGWPELWEKRWDAQNFFGGRMGLSSFLLPLLPWDFRPNPFSPPTSSSWDFPPISSSPPTPSFSPLPAPKSPTPYANTEIPLWASSLA